MVKDFEEWLDEPGDNLIKAVTFAFVMVGMILAPFLFVGVVGVIWQALTGAL
jgi:hypothetical protein